MQGKLKRRLRMLCAAVTSAALVLCVVGGMSPAMAALGKPTVTVGEKVFAFDGTPHHTTVTPPSEEYEVYYSTSKLTILNAKEKGSKDPVARTDAGRTNVYYAVVPVSETPSSANSVASYFSLQVTKGQMADVTIADIPDQELIEGVATPELTVTDPSGYELQLGRDYTVRWTNNAKAGTGKVTVNGYRNYSGYKIATFNIYTNVHSTEGSVPTYAWTGSGTDAGRYTCTATLPCALEGHTDRAVALGNVTVKDYTEPTCSAAGSITFEATFGSEWAETQTKTVTIPALAHAFDEPIWVWADDGRSATANLTCSVCGETVSKAATMSSTVKTAATCTEAGERTYTAQTRVNNVRYMSVKDVVVAALGHTYSKSVTWAADGKSAAVAFTCSTCGTAKSYSFTIGETDFAYDGTDHAVSITTDDPNFKAYLSLSKLYYNTAAEQGTEGSVAVNEVGKYYIYYVVAPADEPITTKNYVSGYVTVKVTKPSMAGITVDEIPDQPWLVGGVEPELELTNSEGYKLEKDKDYSVNWYNNDRPGTATAKINGFNNYSGAVSKNFIVSKDVHWFKGSTPTYSWDGDPLDADSWSCIATRPCLAIEHTDKKPTSVAAVQVDYVAPTCTEDGSITLKASFGEEWAEDQFKILVLPAVGHNYNTATFEWTGTEAATATFSCSRCDATEEKTAAITDRVSVEPTCTTEGERTYTATAISSSHIVSADEKKVSLPANGHNYCEIGEWSWAEDGKSASVKFTCPGCGDTEVTDADVACDVTTPASCTVKGWTTYTATATSKTGTDASDSVSKQDVPLIAHDYAAVVTAPTCTEQGYTTHTCKACGDSYVDAYVDATGHAYGEAAWSWAGTTGATATFTCVTCGDKVVKDAQISSEVTTDPTCTTAGEMTHTASATDPSGAAVTDTASSEIAALGHDLVNHEAKAATCTEIGWDAYDTCSRCDYTTYVEKAALGHDYDAVVTAPTCTAQGYTTHTCSRCDDSYADTYVDAKGHTEVVDAAVEPTCTETGLTQGKHCSVCNEVLVAQNTVDALGHDYDSVVTEPTCTEAGYTTHACSRCDDSYVDTYVDAKGHSYADTVTAPTCTEGGYTTHVCSVCNDTYVDAETPAMGHAYGEPVWAWSEDGKSATVSFACANCNDIQKPTVSVNEGVVSTPASCTEKGWTTYTATATDPSGAPVSAIKAVQDVPMLAHAFNSAVFEWHGTESCTFTFLCDACDATEVVEDTEIEVAVKQEATCTANGIHTYTASATSSSGFEKADVREIADIAALGHDYSVEVSAKVKPTCTEDGHEATYKCSRCDSTSGGEAIEKLGHSYSFNEATGWEWTEDGKSATASFVCETCSNVQKVDAAVSSSKVANASCTENGTTKYTAVAEFEGDSYDTTTTRNDIPALGHDFSVVKDERVEATCTEDGHEVLYKCSRCDETQGGAVIPATGHNYSTGYFDWDGSFNAETKKVTAIFTCENCSGTHNETVQASGSVKTAATCTTKGTTTYSASASYEGTDIEDTFDVVDIPATGHAYNTASFNWAANGKSATVTFACDNGCGVADVHENVTATSEVTTPATCTELGTTTYTVNVTSATGKAVSESTTRDDVDKLGHDFDTASFNWAADGKSATATFDCSRCDATEQKTATITSKVKTAATCTAKGTTTYTAKATSSTGTEKSATKDVVDIAATGHNYNAGTITFAADGKTATAIFTCANNCGVKEEKAATVTSAVKTPATCTVKGWTTYTATATSSNNKIVSATKDVQDIAVLGHNFDTATFNFAADGKSATATFDCSRCDATEEKTAAITSNVKTAATCTAKGTTTYTAKATSSTGTEKSATKDVTDIAALGHDFNTATFNFAADGKSATATFDCSRCDATEDMAAAVTSKVTTPATCTAKGTTTYTATAASSTNKTITATKDVTDVAALGHSYGEAQWAWTGTSAAKATFTCATCGDEVVKDAQITSEQTTAPTCTTKGVTTHTATTTDMSGKTVTATTTSEIAATGHTKVVDAAKAATCTETGLTEGKHCSVCNAVLVAQDVVPAKGHSYDAAAWSWTGTESATATFTCGTCGDSVVKNAAITSEDTTPATCTTKGVRTFTATTTDPSDKTVTSTTTSEIDALGHTDDGSATCPVCGATKTAFAVYSADDTSLNFYKRFEVPTADAQFNGKTATAVYTGIENTKGSQTWNSYASSITSVDFVDSGIQPVSTASWFSFMNTLTTIGGLDKLDTSNVTSMEGMFAGCSKLTSLDVSSFDTANVTNMISMFDVCMSLTSLDVSSFDTSKVTDMSYMFDGCEALTSLDLSSFDTSKVTNMMAMVQGCTALTSVDLSSFNTAKVSSMECMFNLCPSLNRIYAGNTWSVSSVTSSNWMFKGCTNLPNFNSSVVDETNAHTGEGGYLTCVGFKDSGAGHVYADGKCTLCGADDTRVAFAVYSAADKSLNFYKRGTVPTAGSTFDGRIATAVYTGIETSAYTIEEDSNGNLVSSTVPWKGYTSSVTSVSFVDEGIAPVSTACWFYNMSNGSFTRITGLDKLVTAKVTDMSNMFGRCTNLTSLDLSNFNTSRVASMYGLFCYCTKLTSLDLSGFDTSKVTDMCGMFYDCEALTSITGLGSFNTANVTTMNSMFGACINLASLDVSSFNTAKVEDMFSMFYSCSALTSITGLSSFDTANVTSMMQMFYGCSALTTLDVRSFNTAKVTNMYGMFGSCSKLTTLDLTSFNTAKVTDMSGMFYVCSRLSSIYVSSGKWSTASVTSNSYMFYNCGCSSVTYKS